MKSREQVMLRQFVLGNDADAFAALSNQYASLVYRVCWRILRDEHKAADAAQETFLQLLRHAHQIHGSVAAWLHRVATGKAIDIIRKDKRQREHLQLFQADLDDNKKDWAQLSMDIDEALNRLDAQSRDIIIEQYLENRSVREIAGRKGISPATVSRKANAALQSLRQKLRAPGLVVTPAVMSSMFAESSAHAVPVTLVQAMGKMAVAGQPACVGIIAKASYVVGGLSLLVKVVTTAALVTIVALPFIHRLAGDQTDPKHQELLSFVDPYKLPIRDVDLLIDNYFRINNRFQAVSYDLETTIILTEGDKRVYNLKHVSRNTETQWIGGRETYKKDGTFNPELSIQMINIYNDKRGVSLWMSNEAMRRDPSATLFRGLSLPKIKVTHVESPLWGPLTGRHQGSNKHSLYDLIKLASNTKVSSNVTQLIGHDAHRIEVDTQYGQVKAWISPEMDYNCLKWEIIKDHHQFYRDGVIADPEFKMAAVYEAEELKRVDGQYVVTQAKFSYKVKDMHDKLVSHTKIRYKLENINFDPDFEALGAFKLQLPEGTLVYPGGFEGSHDGDFGRTTYRWVGGELRTINR